MEKHYETYLQYLHQNNLEIEFSKIHFMKCEEANEELNQLKNPKRDYLADLLRAESMASSKHCSEKDREE